MGHKGPGHTVHTGQAHQRLVLQHGQGLVVAAGQAIVNLAQLRFDEVKVVHQPLGCGAQVLPAVSLFQYVLVCRAQGADVVAKPWVKGGLAKLRFRGTVGVTQAAAVLGKALVAKHFGAQGKQGGAHGRIQNAGDPLRNPVPMGQGCGVPHPLQRQISSGGHGHDNQCAGDEACRHQSVQRVNAAFQVVQPSAHSLAGREVRTQFGALQPGHLGSGAVAGGVPARALGAFFVHTNFSVGRARQDAGLKALFVRKRPFRVCAVANLCALFRLSASAVARRRCARWP